MRHDDVGRQGPRGPVGGTRENALWGSKRTLQLALSVLIVGVVALGGGRVEAAEKVDAYLSAGLLEEAEASPDALFDVIVQARRAEDDTSPVTKIQKKSQ
jgi:hypothetical protein